MRATPAAYVAAALAAATFCVSGAASAQVFSTSLTVAQEVPPPTGPNLNGMGFGSVEILSPTSLLVDLNVSDLSTNIVGAHIHIGPPGVAGPVVLPLIPNGDTGSNSLVLTDLLFEDVGDLVAGFLGGQPYYFNVHTVQNPAGEVRGQITIPEPGTVALIAGAALPLVGLVRRRRQTK